MYAIARGIIAAVAVAAASALPGPGASAQSVKVRVALGDTISVETLSYLIALERAKEKGVDYAVTSFAKEDLALQAVVNNQADLGIATPYAVIQKSKAPLRGLFQVSRLLFFLSPTSGREDLEGPRRAAVHLPCARQRDGGHRQHHSQAPGHQVRPAELCPGVRAWSPCSTARSRPPSSTFPT